MPTVDDFLRFFAEEIAKEGKYRLVVDAPDNAERYWLVGAADDLGEALINRDSLTEALNHLSQSWSFTNKDLLVAEEPSLVKRVAELAAAKGTALVIQAPLDTPNWSVEAEGLSIRGEALTLESALTEVLNVLLEENE